MRESNTLTKNQNYDPEIEHLSQLRVNYFGSVALAESTLNIVIVIFFQSALVEITSIRTVSGIFSPLLNSIRTNLISNVQLNVTEKSEINNSSKLFKRNALVYLMIFMLTGMFGAFLFSRYSMIPAGTFNNTLVKSIPLGYLLAFLTFLYEATKARFYIAQYARNVMFSVIISSIISLSIANAYSSHFAYILIFCNPILCSISMVLLNLYHKLNEGD